jgi:DNA helicase HerA-like ATPase
MSDVVIEEGSLDKTEVEAASSTLTDGSGKRRVIGKVGAPPMRESTSDQFQFWVSRDEIVEKTQIVRTESNIGNRAITFYALVDEVYRQSRKRNMGEEFDAFDGDVNYEPEFGVEGVTFAAASILRTQPPMQTPPLEQSPVFLGGEAEAQLAYGADEIDNPLGVGLIKNGADVVAGSGKIDLDYLLGTNGGHLNVNGVAGRGTKSSFLLFVIHQLLREARRRAADRPSDPDPLMVVPIVLNVKGYDLFYIDKWNRKFLPELHRADWEKLGVDDPKAFENVVFYAPQMPGGTTPVPTGRPDEVKPYSWSLSNIIERGLLLYLFADEDASDPNFSTLVLDIEAWLTDEKTENDGTTTRRLSHDDGRPNTFQGLLDWITQESRDPRVLLGHHPGTWGKVRRRLLKLVLEGNGVLRRYDQNGNPLDVAVRATRDPVVIDINSLARVAALQRFVVATILRQLVEERTGPRQIPGLVYLVALDELNRFAPRGSRDPITKLIETIAAEMRSQGIILLGAQQQASKVSEIVIEMAGIRALGRSGTLELGQPVWRMLSDSARRKAASLSIDEKMVIQDNFREPMHLRVPFPPWAMNPKEATDNAPDSETALGRDEDDISTY